MDWYNQGVTPITKDTTITVKHFGERAADVEYTQTRKLNQPTSGYTSEEQLILNSNPNNIIDQYTKLLQNGYNGNGETDSKLYQENLANQPTGPQTTLDGNIRDQDQTVTNCMAMQGTRRVGTCNDGLYTLNMRMTDSAGNPGDWVQRTVERDTVSPVNPLVNLDKRGDRLAEYLTLSVQGEATSTAQIEVSNSLGFLRLYNYQMNGAGQLNINDLVGKLACGKITYQVKVKLIDRAGNESQQTFDTLITDECPACIRGAIEGWNSPLSHPQSTITSRHGSVNPSRPNHTGVDLGVHGDPDGVPVFAAKEGTVAFIGIDQYGGQYIDINHEGGYMSRYVHLATSASDFVSVGQYVTPANQIGIMGSTGLSSGNHLHFEIWLNGVDLNPELFINIQGSNLTEAQMAVFCQSEAREGEDTEDGSLNQTDTPTYDLTSSQIELEAKYTDPYSIQFWMEFNNEIISANLRISNYSLDPLKEAGSKCAVWDIMCFAGYAGQAINRTNEMYQALNSGLSEGVGKWLDDMKVMIEAIGRGLWDLVGKIWQYGLDIGKYLRDLEQAFSEPLNTLKMFFDEEFRKAFLIQNIEEARSYLNQSPPKLIRDWGYTVGQFAPEVVIAILSGGTSLSVSASKISAQLAAKVPLLWESLNFLRGAVGKAVTLVNGVVVTIMKVAGKIVAKIDDLIRIVTDATDEAFEAFLKYVKNITDHDLFRKFRSATKNWDNYVCEGGKCFLSCFEGAVASANVNTSAFDSVQMQSTSEAVLMSGGSICNRLSRRINELAGSLPSSITKERLKHVILGNPKDLRKGMHSPQALLDKFKNKQVRVRIDGGSEIFSEEDLLKAINEGKVMRYKDTSIPSGNWGVRKTVFPEGWNVDDIADAGKTLVRECSGITGRCSKQVTINGKSLRVEGYFDENKKLISWYPYNSDL